MRFAKEPDKLLPPSELRDRVNIPFVALQVFSLLLAGTNRLSNPTVSIFFSLKGRDHTTDPPTFWTGISWCRVRLPWSEQHRSMSYCWKSFAATE